MPRELHAQGAERPGFILLASQNFLRGAREGDYQNIFFYFPREVALRNIICYNCI